MNNINKRNVYSTMIALMIFFASASCEILQVLEWASKRYLHKVCYPVVIVILVFLVTWKMVNKYYGNEISREAKSVSSLMAMQIAVYSIAISQFEAVLYMMFRDDLYEWTRIIFLLMLFVMPIVQGIISFVVGKRFIFRNQKEKTQDE